MVAPRQLTDADLLLLTTPDDTEEAPWMTMPDFQWRVIALLMSFLRRYVWEQGLPWYLAAELKITMPREVAPRTLDLAPDLMMAVAEDRERTSWNVRLEGGPPAFVLEVVTDDSWERDTKEKPLLYDRMGVEEYAIFAPRRTDGGPLLFGYRRDARGYFVPWTSTVADQLQSEAMGGITLYVEGRQWLRMRDPDGRRLLSDQEAWAVEAERARLESERAEREVARAEREVARAEREAAARHAAEQRAAAAEQRAAAAEAENARLRALHGSQEPDEER